VKRALVLLVALAALSVPLGARLRADAPPRPDASRIGLGPVLGGVLTGAFRPMLMSYLYIRADILAGEGRFDEQVTLFRNMVQLYPHNAEARAFLGWELAFNSKGEAATRELTIALWFMTQCGQNAYGLVRYAGPEWVEECWIRARAHAWTERAWGRPMHRFDAALHAQPRSEEALARFRRARMLHAALLDDWMRTGESERLAETVAELRWIAWAFQGLPEQERAANRAADALEAIAGGTFDAKDFTELDEHEANALWALGMHRESVPMLRSALAIFEQGLRHPFGSERRIVAAWIDWLAGDRKAPRPPRPFDG